MATQNGDKRRRKRENGRGGGRGNGRTRQTPRTPPPGDGFVASQNLNIEMDEADRERAGHLLKETALFRNLSRRLLIDIVERSVGGRLQDTGGQFLNTFISEESLPQTVSGTTTPGQILAIVVLRGTLIAANKPAGGAPRKPLPSPLPPPDELPGDVSFAMELPPGVYLRGSGRLAELDLGELWLEPPKGRHADVLVVSTGLVDTPAAAWGLDTQAIHMQQLSKIVSTWKRPALIWMGATTGSKAMMEALTHVLAGRIASDYPSEPALLLILGTTWQLLLWQNNRFEPVTPKGGVTKLSLSFHVDVLYDLVGRDKRGRIFVVNPDDPLTKPSALDTVRFDRIVYLTDDIPPRVPQKVRDILRPTLTSSDDADRAHLSSLLPSILCNVDNSKLGAKQRQFKAGHLRRRGIKIKTAKEKASDAFMCCVQDTTFLPLHLEQLEDTWNKWQADGGTAQPDPFLAVAVGSGAISNSVLGNWGRAVTNRRVGVACSGGGASAYRIGPILKRMETAGIPVDVFAGLSGGALIGSFYSRYGMDGFEFARCLGPFFQLTMPLVFLWTRPWEWVMDLLLDGARVEDLGIRFAAVAAALPETDPPNATIVLHGTLGEAVRASGSLPPSFAPTDKNGVRYTDGGAGTAVPAQVARDCGADVVLACNVVPGPKRGNPFSFAPLLGWLVRKTPFIGRIVDNYTWYAFFMAQTSREFGRHADVFVEFDPQDFPFIESTLFIAANRIIDDTENQKDVNLDDRVDELKKKWQAL